MNRRTFLGAVSVASSAPALTFPDKPIIPNTFVTCVRPLPGGEVFQYDVALMYLGLSPMVSKTYIRSQLGYPDPTK